MRLRQEWALLVPNQSLGENLPLYGLYGLLTLECPTLLLLLEKLTEALSGLTEEAVMLQER
jgi:hypothetical protein